MKEYFLNLLAYERWANERILDALEQPRYADGRCLDLFSHILAAQQTWLSRLRGEPRYYPLWERHDLIECAQVCRQMAREWDTYIRNSTEEHLSKTVTYKTGTGEDYSNSVADILAHLVNHDTYHRGQIVEEMRQRKLVPVMPVTDYIVFVQTK